MSSRTDTSIIVPQDAFLLVPARSGRQRAKVKPASRGSQPEAMLALCLMSLLGWLLTGLVVWAIV